MVGPHSQLLTARDRIEPLVHGIPVDGGDPVDRKMTLRPSLVGTDDVPGYPVQPRQRGPAVVRPHPKAGGDGRDEDLPEEILRSARPHPAAKVAVHSRGMPLVDHA